jgi:hypothetical protein
MNRKYVDQDSGDVVESKHEEWQIGAYHGRDKGSRARRRMIASKLRRSKKKR